MKRLVSSGWVAGVVVASAGVLGAAPAGAAGDTSYYADVQGQYATIEGSVGSAFLGNLLSGQITLGELESSASSGGISTLNGFAVPAGVKSGARGDLANVGAGPIKIQTDHVQSTAPTTTGPADRTYLPIALAPVIDAGVIHGESSAAWGPEVFGRNAASRSVATVNGDTGYLRLLDLSGSLGAFASLLPAQLQHPVVEAETLRAHTQVGSVRNSDGTHGLTAGGVGGLASLQIFGGASNGGITLGVFNHDTGAEKDTAGTRVVATGKPGGAGCSYVVPDTVQVAIGSPANKVALPLSTGQRINLPGGLGYLDIRFTGQSHCEASADGTYAKATGAGVGLSFHLTLPTVAGLPGSDIGTFTLTLPDLDSAEVKVPRGGIPPTDGPVPTTPAHPTTPVAAAPQGGGGATSVPTVVDAGTTGHAPTNPWLPLGLATVLSGAGAVVLLRRRLLAG